MSSGASAADLTSSSSSSSFNSILINSRQQLTSTTARTMKMSRTMAVKGGQLTLSSIFVILVLALMSTPTILAMPYDNSLSSRSLEVATSWTNPCGNPQIAPGSRPAGWGSPEVLAMLFRDVFNRAIRAANNALHVKSVFVSIAN